MFYGRLSKASAKIKSSGVVNLILVRAPLKWCTSLPSASTTEASIVVAEMVANQLSDFLLKGVKINTV